MASKDNLLFLISICILYLNFLFISSQQTSGPNFTLVNDNEWKLVDKGYPIDEDGNRSQFYSIKEVDFNEWRFNKSFIEENRLNETQKFIFSFKLWLNYTSPYKPLVNVKVNNSLNSCPTQGSGLMIWTQCEYEMPYDDLADFMLAINRANRDSVIVAFKDFKIESKEKSCELDNSCIGNFSIYTCVESNCYLFDNMLSDTDISNKNIPIITSLDDPILPFYFTTSKDAKLKLVINNFDDSFDTCFQFIYQISQSSSLQISYNNFSSINLTETQVYGENEWFPSESNPQKLCVRDLAKNISNDFEIVLNAIVNDPENEMIALRLINGNNDELLEFIPSNEQLSEFPYLSHWSNSGITDGNYTFENQWPLRLPQNNWFTDDVALYFEGSNTSSPTQQTSYLFSNWINNVFGHKLRFKISNITYKNFDLNVFTFNEQMELNFIKTIDQTIVEEGNYVNIEIGEMETNFKIAFIVDYNSSNGVQLKLESIDMGDPCVFDNTTYNTCTGRGECYRIGFNKHLCECDDVIYTGVNCQLFDYCYYNHNINGVNMTGDEYCEPIGTGKCTTGGYTNFICDCGANQFWNFNKFNCSYDLKCIEKDCDYQSQDCEEPDIPDKDARCVCKSGYRQISSGNDNCVKINPCDDDPCEDPNASCVTYGDNDNAYTCVCNEGFKATGPLPNIMCTASDMCSFPTLNDCQQNCSATNNNDDKYKCSCGDLYKLNGTQCELKNDTIRCDCGYNAFCGSSLTDCQCKLGYKLDDSTKECYPDLNFRAEEICPFGNVTNTTDNKIACYCGDSFELNSQNTTCILKHICGTGGDGRAECDSRSALCITNATHFGKYKCECPPGKTFDDPQSENKTCVDVCDFRNRNTICEQNNAKCNPILINATNNNNDIENVDLFCECNSGLIWSNDKCVISLYSAQFSLSIKNIFRDYFENKSDSVSALIDSTYYFDLEGFVNELQSQNDENYKYYFEAYNASKDAELNHFLVTELTQIMKNTEYNVQNKNQISIRDCQLSSDNYYNCLITVSLHQNFNKFEANLSSQLGDLCIRVSNVSKDCFFLRILTENTYAITESKDYTLVINEEILNNTNFQKYNNCESRTDICDPNKYSNCVENGDSEKSLYSCLCNKDYFTDLPITPSQLPVEGGDKGAVEYTCIVRKLCELSVNNCPKVNGSCFQQTPYKDIDNVWIAPYDCRCNNGFVLINSTIPNTCKAVCEGVDCNSGKCVPKGADTYACVCDERWSGEHCEFSYPLGGWIAGISVLALLLCVAVVIVFIYFRRSKKRDVGFNNNNQQLDDYSATSYRVGQQSGQNPYQGNINHAFNRD